jgi:hypothetical protein
MRNGPAKLPHLPELPATRPPAPDVCAQSLVDEAEELAVKLVMRLNAPDMARAGRTGDSEE